MDAWEDSKTDGILEDNTYANQRGSYILSDISVVNVNYIRNPKKPMLELTGTSRGSVQRLYLVTPTVQTITLWYVSLRHVVRGEDPRVRVMSNWTATLSAIINDNAASVEKELAEAKAEIEASGFNTNIVITFRQHELQGQLGRVVRGLEKILGEIGRMFEGEAQQPSRWTQNQLDLELSAAQRACFKDINQCLDFMWRWGLLNEATALSELRLRVLEGGIEILRAAPECLLRCHSIDNMPT